MPDTAHPAPRSGAIVEFAIEFDINAHPASPSEPPQETSSCTCPA
jgi:hypothetical protein